MSTVGIIANPAAGKDIRRLVAHGRFIPDQEKVNTIKRIIAGINSVDVDNILAMPDSAMLVNRAIDPPDSKISVNFLDMMVRGDEQDTSNAAQLMREAGVGSVITLGGDGTNRAVAKTIGEIPLIPISTGTNNVFPYMIEGTVAGLAAGVVAKQLIDVPKITNQVKRLEIFVDGDLTDIALVDVAVSKEPFIGARAIWEIDTIEEIFLARSEPTGIGLSAIGARLTDLSKLEGGIHIKLGCGKSSVFAPLVPGYVAEVPILDWSFLPLNHTIDVELKPCTIALDGERLLSGTNDKTITVSITANGPNVVDVDATIRAATSKGVFCNSL